MLAEEREHAAPRVFCRLRVVAETGDAQQRLAGQLVGEAVPGVGIALDIGGDVFGLRGFAQFVGRTETQRVAAAEARHNRAGPVQRLAQVAWQWRAVERRGGAKALRRHHKCEPAAHAEARNTNVPGAFRHAQQVIAGSQNVVERATPLASAARA